MKTPFEMVVSAVRALDAQVDYAFALANQIGNLGEPLYRKLEPTGYSNLNAEWVNSAALLARMNFALPLAQNHVPGVKVDVSRFEQRSERSRQERCCSAPTSPQTRAAIRESSGGTASRRTLRRWWPAWCSVRRIFKEESEVHRMTSRRVFLKGSALAMFGVGSTPAWLSRSRLRGRGAQRAQENPGGDLPARRGGRPQRGGAVRRAALLRAAAVHRDPQARTARRNSAIDLDGFFGLHPALAPLKPIYDARHLAIVDAVGSPDPTRSHFDAQDYMESGTPGPQGDRRRLAESRSAAQQPARSRRCAP